MRTTIDIDDDVLNAVKELARAQHISAGQLLSRFARQALSGQAHARADDAAGKPVVLPGGFRPFVRPGSPVVSNEDINRLRDIEGV